jgi:hypothetical protein
MRTAINENRTVQLALVAVLALAGLLIFFKVSGGGSKSSAAESTSTAGVASTAAPVTGATPTAAAVDPATGLPTTTGATTGVSSTVAPVPADLIPGPGLPKSLLDAYKRGDAVALLVVRAGGTDDALVAGSLPLLHGVHGMAVFSTKAKQISRYAWLTQGVDLTELPALVILLPKSISKGEPKATVSYGFRDPASVLQAAKDALYRGPTDLPYHP